MTKELITQAGAIPALPGYAALAASEAGMTVKERLAEWFAALTPMTRVAYEGDLKLFARWLGAIEGRNITVDEAVIALAFAEANDTAQRPTLLMIERFAGHLTANGLKASSVATTIAPLQSVLRLLARSGIGPGRQDVKIAVEKDENLRVLPENGVISAALIGLKRTATAQALRDRAMVELMARAGLRRREVITMNLADIDADRCMIRVKGKGKSGKVDHPIATATCAALHDWLAVRGAVALEAEALFVSVNGRTKGKRLTVKAVNDACKRIGIAVTGEGLEPHDLRRVAVTNVKRAVGMDDAQDFARHARRETTQIYVAAAEKFDAKRRAVDALASAF